MLLTNHFSSFERDIFIHYFVPFHTQNAHIIFYDMHGKKIKLFKNLEKWKGRIYIEGTSLRAGTYFYALFIEGQQFASRQLFLTACA